MGSAPPPESAGPAPLPESAGSAPTIVDDYVMLHHDRGCSHNLWSAIYAANGTVVRRDAASTLVRAADVVHVVDRTARVGCVAAHEWFPLRVRLPRVTCADPYMRYQSYLADEGVVRAWGRSAAPIASVVDATSCTEATFPRQSPPFEPVAFVAARSLATAARIAA